MGCLPPALEALPNPQGYRLLDGAGTGRMEVPSPEVDALPFPLQVEDYGENTYYSSFISQLDGIRHPGEER